LEIFDEGYVTERSSDKLFAHVNRLVNILRTFWNYM